MFKIYDGRTNFYQWDLNQKLVVFDDSITEVHFCNKTDDCALVCEVYKDGTLNLVNVPNILLQDDWTIRAYAVAGDSTEHEGRFKVLSRSKPADYVYTETECKTFDSLENELKEYVDNALNDIYVGEVGQPNWEQNDPGAKDYIKGRTHYKEEAKENVLLEEQAITIPEDGMYQFNPTIELKEEFTYTVKFDGIEYECKAMLIEENGENGIVIGNYGAIKPDMYDITEEPFIILYVIELKATMLLCFEPGEHTCSIKESRTIYKTLDPNYLDKVWITNLCEGVVNEAAVSIEESCNGYTETYVNSKVKSIETVDITELIENITISVDKILTQGHAGLLSKLDLNNTVKLKYRYKDNLYFEMVNVQKMSNDKHIIVFPYVEGENIELLELHFYTGYLKITISTITRG